MSRLDIIIPVFNEEDNLDKIIKKVEENDYCGLEKRIIIVDDCSKDKSKDILSNYKNHTVICHKKNMGKGAAIRTGLSASSADIVIIQDADLEYDPQDYNKILPHIINNEEVVVYGSRFLENKSFKSFLFLSYLANIFLTKLTNIIFKSNLTDMETCYKAFRRDVLSDVQLKSNKFEIEVELTAKVIKKGIKIKEIPISYNGRKYRNGKKISAIDGLHAIFALLYYKFFN